MFQTPIQRRRLDAVKRFLLHSQMGEVSNLTKHILWYLTNSSQGLVLPVKISLVQDENGFTEEEVLASALEVGKLFADQSNNSLNKVVKESGSRLQFFLVKGYHEFPFRRLVLGEGMPYERTSYIIFLCNEPFDYMSKEITYFKTTKDRLVGTGIISDGLEELYIKKAA